MDRIGEKFNRLTIIEVYYKMTPNIKKPRKDKFAKCKCECGNEHHADYRAVVTGNTKSCGCLRVEKAKQYIDIIGKRYGRLVVVEKTEQKVSKSNRSIVWKCKCDCGEYKLVPTTMLNTGKTKSCGCLAKEKIPETYFKSGEDHHGWDGGITPIGQYVRERMKDWKNQSIYFSNYKCIISGKKFNVVHHLYPFNKIIKEAMDALNIAPKPNINEYNEKELDQIVLKCDELHQKNGLGACLTSKLHNEFHRTYGYKDFTPENFQEFYYAKTGKQLDLSIFYVQKEVG